MQKWRVRCFLCFPAGCCYFRHRKRTATKIWNKFKKYFAFMIYPTFILCIYMSIRVKEINIFKQIMPFVSASSALTPTSHWCVFSGYIAVYATHISGITQIQIQIHMCTSNHMHRRNVYNFDVSTNIQQKYHKNESRRKFITKLI